MDSMSTRMSGVAGPVRYAWPDKLLARKLVDLSSSRHPGVVRQKYVFHTGFERIPTASRKPRASLEGVHIDNYAIGDTVFVATKSGEPCIAVIVAMWYICPPSGAATEEDESDGEDDFLEESRMHIIVHRFLRPELDLPKIRSQRPYRKKEIYYAVNRENTSLQLRITPAYILRRCTISSDPTRFSSLSLTEAEWAKRPAESSHSQPLPPETPSKRGRTSRAPVQQADSAFDFLCLSAHDAQLGIYYDFSWEQFRRESLKHSAPSRKFQDFNGDGWNLQVDRLPPPRAKPKPAATPKAKPSNKTPKATKPRTTKPKQGISTTPTKSASRQQLPAPSSIFKEAPDSDSGSESSASGSDIYQPPSDNEHEEVDEPLGDLVPDNLDDDEDPVSDDDVEILEDDIPQTPRKQRAGATSPTKRGRQPKQDDGLKTPSKPRAKRIAAPTPHSKAALRKRKSVIDLSRLRGATNADGDSSLGVASTTLPDSVGPDPHRRAMYALHVGARPGSLPCRDNELVRVLGDVADLVTSGVGGCIYISGLPGTGKTATVHAVIRELKGMAMRNEINPFSYVEINGLRIPEPSAAYALLWEAISGHDPVQQGHLSISSKEALRRLTRHFNSGTSAGSHACVVLMDELDLMVTAKQDVVYNFFNWPNLPESNLIVIAVANTHDLPERTMSAKVRSRLGMERINFEAYTVQQLVEIVNARLEVARAGQADQTQVMKPDAINFAARKVASIFGDARRVLDVCRRAVEVCHSPGGSRVVTIQDVVEVIKSMDKSSTADYIRDCSFHERLLLASMISRMRRAGVDSVKWDDVTTYHMSQSVMLGKHKPTRTELRSVLDSLVVSRAVIAEDVGHRAEGERLVALKLERDAVERILCAEDLGGERWKSVLGL